MSENLDNNENKNEPRFVEPVKSKYAHHFEKELGYERLRKPEPEYIPDFEPLPPTIPEKQNELTLEAVFKIGAILGGIIALGLFGVLLFRSGKKEEFKPKTRTVTRTVYVRKDEKDKGSNEKEDGSNKGKTKEGQDIETQEEEGFEL